MIEKERTPCYLYAKKIVLTGIWRIITFYIFKMDVHRQSTAIN